MAKIKFSNGQVVNFNGNPTQADVEEVAKKLGLGGSTAPAAPTSSVAEQMNPIQKFGTEMVATAVNAVSDAGKKIEATGQKYTPQPGQSFLERAKNLALATAHDVGAISKGVVGALGAPVSTAIAPVVKPVASAVMGTQTAQDLKVRIDEFVKQNPEKAALIGDTANLASFLALGLAKSPDVKDIHPIQATKDVANIIGGDIKSGAQSIASLAGKPLTKTGELVYKSAFDPTVQEAQLIQGNKIKLGFLKKERAKLSPGTDEYTQMTKDIEAVKASAPRIASETALQKGIMGTEKRIGTKSGVEKMDVWKNTVEPALKSSPDTITKAELFSKIEERIANEIEPTRKAALQNAYEAIQQDYTNFDGANLLDANRMKTSLDNFTPSKIFKGQEVASELKTLKADMASAIREKTYESLKDVKIKMQYRDYANLKQLEGVGIKAITEGGYKGGFGSFWHTAYDMATTPVKTVGGQVLYRVGNYLQFLGKPGIKTLGQKLASEGISQTDLLTTSIANTIPQIVNAANSNSISKNPTTFSPEVQRILNMRQ